MNKIDLMKLVAALVAVLPLPEGTTAENVTEDQLLDGIDSLFTEEEATEMENRLKELEAEVKCNREAEADRLIVEHGIAADKASAIKNRFVENPVAVRELFAALPKQEKAPVIPAPLTNREGAKAPAASPAAAVADKTTVIETEVRAIMNRDKCGYEAAFNSVRATKPELFN